MAVMRKHSREPKQTKAKSWDAQAGREISLVSAMVATSALGRVVDVEQRSTRERCLTKKYMGVCRRVLRVTAIMIETFPRTAARYMSRKEAVLSSCIAGTVEKPWRMNTDTAERLAMACLGKIGTRRVHEGNRQP